MKFAGSHLAAIRESVQFGELEEPEPGQEQTAWLDFAPCQRRQSYPSKEPPERSLFMKMPHVYCLLSCVLVISLLGCGKHDKLLPPPPPLDGITITNCEPSPDEKRIQDNKPLSWYAADRDYWIEFLPTQTPSGPAIPIPQANNPFLVRRQITVPTVMHGPTSCTLSNGCYYKYNVSYNQNNHPQSPPCRDPGVRVVP